jgi:hypothetical protein
MAPDQVIGVTPPAEGDNGMEYTVHYANGRVEVWAYDKNAPPPPNWPDAKPYGRRIGFTSDRDQEREFRLGGGVPLQKDGAGNLGYVGRDSATGAPTFVPLDGAQGRTATRPTFDTGDPNHDAILADVAAGHRPGYIVTLNPETNLPEVVEDPHYTQTRADTKANTVADNTRAQQTVNQTGAQYAIQDTMTALQRLAELDAQKLQAAVQSQTLTQDQAWKIWESRKWESVLLPQAIIESQQRALTDQGALASQEGAYTLNRANGGASMGRDAAKNTMDVAPYQVGANYYGSLKNAEAGGGLDLRKVDLGSLNAPDPQGAYNQGVERYRMQTPSFDTLRASNPQVSYQPTEGTGQYVMQAIPQPVDFGAIPQPQRPYQMQPRPAA